MLKQAVGFSTGQESEGHGWSHGPGLRSSDEGDRDDAAPGQGRQEEDRGDVRPASDRKALRQHDHH